MTAFKFKTNINCSNCIRTVSPFLNALDSIDEWKVDTSHSEKILSVLGDETAGLEAQNAVKEAGFSAEPLTS